VETLRAKTPVFTDESGRRVTVLQWAARGLCACLVLVGTAVAIAMVTHVPLPGLGRLAPPASDSAPGAARDATTDGGGALDAGLTARSSSGSIDGTAARLASRQEATEAARRTAVEGRAAEIAARPLSVATIRPAAQGAAGPSGSGSVQTPKPQPTTSPTVSNNPPSRSNANPHATARSANSAARATPQTTAKTENPRATTAKSSRQSSSASPSTPPGSMK
jgi:hypothetical protein